MTRKGIMPRKRFLLSILRTTILIVVLWGLLGGIGQPAYGGHQSSTGSPFGVHIGWVPVDIKPQSCPNPLNVNARGVLPVAIVGFEAAGFEFDAEQLLQFFDPESVKLGGVLPLRWNVEDVATPSDFDLFPFDSGDKEEATDCTDEGPDGIPDIVLHFDTQSVVNALGPVASGDVLVLSLKSASCSVPEDGCSCPEGVVCVATGIRGEDVVVIRGNGGDRVH